MARHRQPPNPPFCHGCRRQFAPGDPMRALNDNIFHERCWDEVVEDGLVAFHTRYPTEKESQQATTIASLEAKISGLNAQVADLRTLYTRVMRQSAQHKANSERHALRASNAEASLRNAMAGIQETPAVSAEDEIRAAHRRLAAAIDGPYSPASPQRVARNQDRPMVNVGAAVAAKVAADEASAKQPEGPVDTPADRFNMIELD